MSAGRLLDAAAEASRAGDSATAQAHLLAAASLLEAEGRAEHARTARELARACVADTRTVREVAEDALRHAREHGDWERDGVLVTLRGELFTLTSDREVVVVPASDEAHAVLVLRRLLARRAA